MGACWNCRADEYAHCESKRGGGGGRDLVGRQLGRSAGEHLIRDGGPPFTGGEPSFHGDLSTGWSEIRIDFRRNLNIYVSDPLVAEPILREDRIHHELLRDRADQFLRHWGR